MFEKLSPRLLLTERRGVFCFQAVISTARSFSLRALDTQTRRTLFADFNAARREILVLRIEPVLVAEMAKLRVG